MKRASRETRAAVLATAGILAILAAAIAWYVFFGVREIRAAYDDMRVFPPLEWVRGVRESDGLDEHLRAGRLLLSRILFLGLAANLIALGVLFRRRVIEIVRGHFLGAAGPVGLAIFRIVVFALIGAAPSIHRAVFWAEVPAVLRQPPFGCAWFMRLAPINGEWAGVLAQVLAVASFLAMIGLFTRASAIVTVATAYYVLLLDQMFGKENHYYPHLVWFAALLAFSPCAHTLSVDAFVAAWRRADRGEVTLPAESSAYAVPIRWAWVLMGVAYFFPGFWKWWEGGIDWVWGDNLKYMLYQKWLEKSAWLPPFRLDRYPLLCHASAAATVLFELSWLFLIFVPALRLPAAAMGLAFHNLTNAFIRIPFFTLQWCYVTFVNWDRLFRWIGARLFREEMVVVYDGNCRLCRRVIASLAAFDLLGRIRWVSAQDEAGLAAAGLDGIDRAPLVADMHAFLGKSSWAGYDSYRALARRIPALWPLLPLLYLPPVPQAGRAIYRRVADSRTCSVGYGPLPTAGAGPLPSARPLRVVTVLAAGILAGNLYCGAVRERVSWPFTCYPTFHERKGPETRWLQLALVERNGAVVPIDDRRIRKKLSPPRFAALVRRVIAPKAGKHLHRNLSAVLTVWASADPKLARQLRHARAIRFSEIRLRVAPEEWSKNPVGERLLLETKLTKRERKALSAASRRRP